MRSSSRSSQSCSSSQKIQSLPSSPFCEFEILLIVCAIIALAQLHTLIVNTEEIDDEVYTYPYQPKTVELSFNKKHEPISLPRISCEYLSKEKCITVPEIKVISETFEKMCENR